MSAWEKVTRFMCGVAGRPVEWMYLCDEVDAARAEDAERVKQGDAFAELVRDEAARQASAAAAAREHSDPDAPERARAHEFCAAVLDGLLDSIGR